MGKDTSASGGNPPQAEKGLHKGDRTMTPDGIKADVLEVHPYSIVVQFVDTGIKGIYPRGVLQGDDRGPMTDDRKDKKPVAGPRSPVKE
ncbi:MAG: hypothetical protein ACE5GT_12655 [Rhodospirillales bacterium]